MQRKLKLAVEDLSVESFRIPQSHGRERGTVRANSYSPDDPEYNSYDKCMATEPGSDSYGENTCGWTCSQECRDRQTMGGGGGSSQNWGYANNGMC